MRGLLLSLVMFVSVSAQQGVLLSEFGYGGVLAKGVKSAATYINEPDYGLIYVAPTGWTVEVLGKNTVGSTKIIIAIASRTGLSNVMIFGFNCPDSSSAIAQSRGLCHLTLNSAYDDDDIPRVFFMQDTSMLSQHWAWMGASYGTSSTALAQAKNNKRYAQGVVFFTSTYLTYSDEYHAHFSAMTFPGTTMAKVAKGYEHKRSDMEIGMCNVMGQRLILSCGGHSSVVASQPVIKRAFEGSCVFIK